MFSTDISPIMLYNITNGQVESEEQLILSVDQMTDHQEDEFYFLIGNKIEKGTPAIVEVFGSPSDENFLGLANFIDVFKETAPSIMIHGVIQDPTCLPYTMGTKKVAVVIMHETSVKVFKTMIETTSYIESNIDDVTSIDCFQIIIGEESDFDAQEWEDIVKGIHVGGYHEQNH